MSAIGTSQESSDTDIVKQMAIRNKICGVDIQHIGIQDMVVLPQWRTSLQ